MSRRKAMQSLANLEKALARLEEALDEDDMNSLYIDGTIQRFEFTFELFWKTIKRLLEEEGIEAKTPKETLKQAYAIDWLQDEHAWLQMLRDRNETSYVYDENKARQIYENIVDYFPKMKRTFKQLNERFQGDRNESSND
ncbi:nucleotidyltransferase [Virgibacillus phasianinus]|uniref:Nucleotidyltransferase n=1 Tax=Virgibacillus phasianinus TaxID=2017483 RepID=A0A220U2P9_9BACI|nr:nucleotidyltransferase substrate binding protein [Virgibacillus phasianinus]ASK62357.1 nucleotidyltransferase [Virgibacillus phasianinus]